MVWYTGYWVLTLAREIARAQDRLMDTTALSMLAIFSTTVSGHIPPELRRVHLPQPLLPLRLPLLLPLLLPPLLPLRLLPPRQWELVVLKHYLGLFVLMI